MSDTKSTPSESKVVPMRAVEKSAEEATEKKTENAAPSAPAESKAVKPNVPGTTTVVRSETEKKEQKPAEQSKPETAAKAKPAAPAKKTSSSATAQKAVAKKAASKPAKKKTAKKAAAPKAGNKAVAKTPAQLSAPRKNAATQPGTSAVEKIVPFKTMEETMSKTTKQFDAYSKEAAEIGRETFDAAIKSSTIMAKGFEEIVRASMALAQSAAEKQANFAKEAMTSKTINEWAEIQNKIAQSSFDDFMAGATKISEMAVKTLSDASEPVNEQMTKAVNAVQKAAA